MSAGPPGGIGVRRAQLDDAADAAAYRRLLDAYASDPMGQGESLSPAVLDRVVTDLSRYPGTSVFLAWIDGTPGGFATCFPGYSTFRAAPLLNIHDIAVLPQYRARGIARALLRQIAAVAREQGCCKLTLEVREDNPAAQALYAAEGFGTARAGDRDVRYLFLEKSL